MSEDIDKLKSIGVEQIHEKTHITKAYIQAILDEQFDILNSVQLLGFVSILEREYGVNLSELKNAATVYFVKNSEVKEDSKELFTPNKKRVSNLVYIIVGVVVVFLYLNMLPTNDKTLKVVTVDNSVIDSTNKKEKLGLKEESSKSDELEKKLLEKPKEIIVKKEKLKKIQEIKKQSVASSFKITTKNRVWLGYIDLATHKKYQKVVKKEFSLEANKNWLLIFGHGHISIEIDGVIKKYKKPGNIRFSYIDSKLKEISIKELKDLNKGRRW
jgi:hypothetical protein